MNQLSARAAIRICLVALLLTGCSTHDARYATTSTAATTTSNAAPAESGLKQAEALEASLLDVYSARPRSLATAALATLSQAGAEAYLAVRDVLHGQATVLVRSAEALAASLLERTPTTLSLGSTVQPDSLGQLAAEGDALVDVFLATGRSPYRAAVARFVQLLISRRQTLLGDTGPRDQVDRVQVALFLQRAADIDVSSADAARPDQPPSHQQIVGQKALVALLIDSVARQVDSAVIAAPGGAKLVALIESPALTSAYPAALSVARHFLPILESRFATTGSPVGFVGLVPPAANDCWSYAALPPGSRERLAVLDWITAHTAGGSVPLAAAINTQAQAECLRAIASDLSLGIRGILPQP